MILEGAEEVWGVKFTAGGWDLTSVKFTNYGMFDVPGGNHLKAWCLGWNNAWSQVVDNVLLKKVRPC